MGNNSPSQYLKYYRNLEAEVPKPLPDDLPLEELNKQALEQLKPLLPIDIFEATSALWEMQLSLSLAAYTAGNSADEDAILKGKHSSLTESEEYKRLFGILDRLYNELKPLDKPISPATHAFFVVRPDAKIFTKRIEGFAEYIRRKYGLPKPERWETQLDVEKLLLLYSHNLLKIGPRPELATILASSIAQPWSCFLFEVTTRPLPFRLNTEPKERYSSWQDAFLAFRGTTRPDPTTTDTSTMRGLLNIIRTRSFERHSELEQFKENIFWGAIDGFHVPEPVTMGRDVRILSQKVQKQSIF